MKIYKESYGYYDMVINEESGEISIIPISDIFGHLSNTLLKFETIVDRTLSQLLKSYSELVNFVKLYSKADVLNNLRILYQTFPRQLLIFQELKLIYQELKRFNDTQLKLKRIIVEWDD